MHPLPRKTSSPVKMISSHPLKSLKIVLRGNSKWRKILNLGKNESVVVELESALGPLQESMLNSGEMYPCAKLHLLQTT